MTGRDTDLGARVEGMRQLGLVVNAMRGIAAARAREAREQLLATDSYAAFIAHAIGQALSFAPTAAATRQKAPVKRALVIFCAEQGFAGAFSERVLDSLGEGAKTDLFIVGTRGAAIATERGLKPVWTGALPAHSSGIPKLADTIAEALYARISAGTIDALDVVFTQLTEGRASPRRLALFPFDTRAFPLPKARNAPLIDLSPDVLLRDLTADYVHAQLCEAALHGFAAENETRMQTMAAAHDQVQRELTTLTARQRQARQEEITAEVIELSAGETASRATAFR